MALWSHGAKRTSTPDLKSLKEIEVITKILINNEQFDQQQKDEAFAFSRLQNYSRLNPSYYLIEKMLPSPKNWRRSAREPIDS